LRRKRRQKDKSLKRAEGGPFDFFDLSVKKKERKKEKGERKTTQ